MEDVMYFINPMGKRVPPDRGENTHSELASNKIMASKDLNRIYSDLCRMNRIYNDYLTDPICGTSNFLVLYGYVKYWHEYGIDWYMYSAKSIKGTVLEELINRLKHMQDNGNEDIELVEFFSDFSDKEYEKMLEYILKEKNKMQSIDEEDLEL